MPWWYWPLVIAACMGLFIGAVRTLMVIEKDRREEDE